MLSIAVDRYFYIVHPFVHMRHVTPRRISIFIIVQWILAGLYGIVPIYIFNAEESKGCNPFYVLSRRFVAFSHPILFFIDCVGIGITYGLIAKVARQHSSQKNKRALQINAVIANNTTNREKCLNSNSVAGEVKRNMFSGDMLKCECIEQKDVNHVDGLASGATIRSCETKDEKVSALYGNLERAGNSHTREDNMHIGINGRGRSDVTHDILNEKTTVLISGIENKFMVPNFKDNKINSADKENEVVVFQTNNTIASTVNQVVVFETDYTIAPKVKEVLFQTDDTIASIVNEAVVFQTNNTLASTVNKHGAPCVGFQSEADSFNGHSVLKINPGINNQDGVITSDKPVNETECIRSYKTITESSGEINNKGYSDSKDNTDAKSSYNKMQVDSYLDSGSNITKKINSNNAECGTLLLTSNCELTVNSDSEHSEANIDQENNTLAVNKKLHGDTYLTANINIQTVKCDNSQGNASLCTSGNTTTEKCINAQAMVTDGNHSPPVEEQHCQTSQAVSPWSLASLRWMKQMIMVFGLFVFCWTPTMVSILISTVREPNPKVVYVLGMFGIANSAVNFFVYSLCNKTYSEAIKRMCRVRRGQ
ncbi:hypothetical protein BsWGS_10942 [Bradybaena similaris]